MLRGADEELDTLEYELKGIFDETAYEPEQALLFETARCAAQVPGKACSRWKRWMRMAGPPVMVFAGLLWVSFGVTQTASFTESVRVAHSQVVTHQDAPELATQDWDDLGLLSAGDLGFELLDLPGADLESTLWEEAYEDVLEEI